MPVECGESRVSKNVSKQFYLRDNNVVLKLKIDKKRIITKILS